MTAAGVQVWCVVPEGATLDPTLEKLVARTGGKRLKPAEALAVTDRVEHVVFEEKVAPAEHQEELNLQLDLVRNRDRSAQVITFVMLLLEGLSLGICLSLMMSSAGQFRAQYIISPLMGVAAFVLLKLIWKSDDLTTWWIKEGICFSLLGIVFMRKNLFRSKAKTVKAAAAPADNDDWG